MKFKATLKESGTFTGVCQACRSIQRRCVIKLHPQRIRFFTSTTVTDGMQVWASCACDALFKEFRIESQYSGNAIFFEIADLGHLSRITRAAERRSNVTMKLAKGDKNRPVLKLFTKAARTQLTFSHDIPIRILSESDIENISAPPLDDRVVKVVLPSLADIATFAEKLKSADCELINFSVTLAIEDERGGTASRKRRRSVVDGVDDNIVGGADDDGEEEVGGLGTDGSRGSARGGGGERGAAASGGVTHCNVLELYSDSVKASFALRYDNVEVVNGEARRGGREEGGDEEDESGDEGGREPPLRRATVAVELKKFMRFLSIKEVSPMLVELHLVDSKALVLSVCASGGTILAGYMPAFVR